MSLNQTGPERAFGPIWHTLSSLPGLTVATGVLFVGCTCLLIGLYRAARSGGIPVTARRFVRQPAAPLSMIGAVLLLLDLLDMLVIALLPGI